MSPLPPSQLRRLLTRGPVGLLLAGALLLALVVAPLDFVLARHSVRARGVARAEALAAEVAMAATRAHAAALAELYRVAGTPEALELLEAYGTRDPARWGATVGEAGSRLRGSLPRPPAGLLDVSIRAASGALVYQVLAPSAPPGPAKLEATVPVERGGAPPTGLVVGHLGPPGLLPATVEAELVEAGAVARVSGGGGAVLDVTRGRGAPLIWSTSHATAPGWTASVGVPTTFAGTPWDAMLTTRVWGGLLALGVLLAAGTLLAHNGRGRVARDPRAGWVLDWLTAQRPEHDVGENAPRDLAAELSHEIRNPLTALRMNLQGLWRSLGPSGGPNARAVQISLREIDRLDALARTALGLAREGSEPQDRVDLGHVLAQSVAAVEAQLRQDGVRITHRWSDGLHVRGREGQLRGAVINLLVNAAQAAGAGGTIRAWVETATQGRRAHLHVADDGPGVPADLAARIFEPFFTTRNEGTGLGLPLAQRTAREHRGTLKLVPSEKGAHFVLDLPILPRRGP